MKFNLISSKKIFYGDQISNGLSNYLISIPVLSATLFSFIHLDANSFWLDEVYSIYFASLSWSQLWEIITHSEANMSLYYVLLKIWISAFGNSEFAVRSLSATFAVGGVIITYAIGIRLFDIQTGLTASLFLAVNAFFITYAQEARGYTLLLLLSTCSMYLLIRAIESQQYKFYIGLGLTNVLALYAHFFGFFVLISQVVSLAFLPPGTIRWKRLLTCAVPIALLAAPLGIFILVQENPPMSWIDRPSLLYFYFLFKTFTGGKLQLIFYFVLCLLSLIFTIQILLRFKISLLLWRYALLFSWLFVPILSAFLLSLFKPLFVARYLISTLPALVLLASAGLMSLRTRPLRVIAASLLIIFSLRAVFYVYDHEKKDDWRAATRFIVQNEQAGDVILFYSSLGKIPFEYYYRNSNAQPDSLVSVYPAPFGIFISTKVEDPSETMIESLSERYNRLWVVLYLDNLENMGWNSRPLIQMIEKKYVNQKSVSFKGIFVKLYVRLP